MSSQYTICYTLYLIILYIYSITYHIIVLYRFLDYSKVSKGIALLPKNEVCMYIQADISVDIYTIPYIPYCTCYILLYPTLWYRNPKPITISHLLHILNHTSIYTTIHILYQYTICLGTL